MEVLKEYNLNKMQQWVDAGDPKAEDRISDRTLIGSLLLFSFGLRIAYQIIIIANVVYFVAIFWWILAVS